METASGHMGASRMAAVTHNRLKSQSFPIRRAKTSPQAVGTTRYLGRLPRREDVAATAALPVMKEDKDPVSLGINISTP